MNRRAKGLTTMRKARRIGEALGYRIEQALHTRYKKDFFGLFDQIWLKKGEIIFVQVKTNQSITKKITEKFRKWSRKYGIPTMIINYLQAKRIWEIMKFIPTKRGIEEVKMVFESKGNSIIERLWMRKREGEDWSR